MLKAGMFLGNRYEIGERIGSGGTSDVYKAKDHKLSRSVAIKVLKAEFNTDRNFVQKFRSEAQAAASLSHQNIVNVYDVGEEDDIHYIVMELIDGITLKRYIEKKGRLTSRETIGIAIQVAQGIEVAHGEHIVHRDIKPQNVIISRDGKVKVTDFGIARAASSQTISSNAMGSVHYISPEQARGGYCDERSDIYSLGVTMYEMITGRVPYDGENTVAVALQHIQGEALAPSEFAPDIYFSLERIIEKCMQKKPEYRYASITALIADLKRSLVSPDEDFVKITAVAASRPTRVISEEEIEQINAAAAENEEKERAYLMGDEIEDEEALYDEDYEDEEPAGHFGGDEHGGRNFEKIMVGVGIGVAALIVVLVIFVLGNVFGLFGGGGRDRESAGVIVMDMPDIFGYEFDRAKEILEQNGLTYRVESAQDPDYDDGQVVDTDPDAGERVTSEDRIIVYVNSTEVTIPRGQIVGFQSSAAAAALRNLGLNVVEEEEFDEEVPEGAVISCDPAEGSSLAMGATVTLKVSKGAENQQVTVPSVVGSPMDQAAATIQSMRLVCSPLEEASTTVSQGYVIRQSPAADTQVDPGTTVTIYVSTGPSVAQVPNVTGKDIGSAQSELGAAGFPNVSVTYDYSDSVPNGCVINQTPAAGTTLTVGTSVTIVVSQGP
ncbi:MAG: Stk1 family PASTA domain-containing Ser/Thr kinase, partial [Lachnospiraceae bacterium]|nr:Stk1 family PASTA domain-containing Ser/Thr kinase [Lachnospiraceae bacterium]